MQHPIALLSATLLALGLGSIGSLHLAPQDPQEEAPLDTYASRQAKRLAKLEAGLQGTWKLVDYRVPDEVLEGEDALSGWIMVRDGYLSWAMYGSVEVEGLFGSSREANLEALLFQYRLTSNQELQLASLSGFSDLAETDGLVFDDGHNALDFDLLLNDQSLTLSNPGVESYVFRLLGPAQFPGRAIRALETQTDFEDEDEER